MNRIACCFTGALVAGQARGCGGPCHRFAPTGSLYDPEAEAKPYLARARTRTHAFLINPNGITRRQRKERRRAFSRRSSAVNRIRFIGNKASL